MCVPPAHTFLRTDT